MSFRNMAQTSRADADCPSSKRLKLAFSPASLISIEGPQPRRGFDAEPAGIVAEARTKAATTQTENPRIVFISRHRIGLAARWSRCLSAPFKRQWLHPHRHRGSPKPQFAAGTLSSRQTSAAKPVKTRKGHSDAEPPAHLNRRCGARDLSMSREVENGGQKKFGAAGAGVRGHDRRRRAGLAAGRQGACGRPNRHREPRIAVRPNRRIPAAAGFGEQHRPQAR